MEKDVPKNDDPYIIVPIGEPAFRWQIHKVGPRGGRHFVVGYNSEIFAKNVISTLNAFHSYEK